MKKVYKIRFWDRVGYKQIIFDIIEKVKDQVETYQIEEYGRIGQVTVEANNPVYYYLMELLENNDVLYNIGERRLYSQKEMQDSEFFHMKIYWPWRNVKKTSEMFGTNYHFHDYCEECGREPVQNSDLYIPSIKASKYDICMSLPEIIVAVRTSEILEKNSITGYELRTVRDSRSKSICDLKQLIINNYLPEMATTTEFNTRICEECKRISQYPKSEIVYEKKNLEKAKDFNYSYESNSIEIDHNKFAIQYYCIVSAKVWKIFCSEKIKKVEFEPVAII